MLSLITNRLWTPERIAKAPVRVPGGYIFTHPPNDLWRYNARARRQAIQEWATFGAAALASAIGGSFMLPPVFGTLVASGDQYLPGLITRVNGAPSTQTVTIDNSPAGEYHALVFRATRAGVIDRVAFFPGTATGSPTVDIELQTVSATDGFPTGTILGATNNAKSLGVSASSNTWLEATLGETATVTKGQLLALVIRYASGTSLQLRLNGSAFVGLPTIPYMVTNTTGSVAKSGDALLCCGIRFNDVSWLGIPGVIPVSSTTLAENTASGGVNHKGNVYTTPVPRRAKGGVIVSPSSTLDFSVAIAANAWDGTLDNDGTSNIGVAIDKDTHRGATAPVYWLSDAELAMAAAGDYRSIIKATDASNISLYFVTVPAAANLDALECGQALRWTQATTPTGSGDWTNTLTKRAFTGFWFDQADDGTATGGGPVGGGNMRGGFSN